MPCNQRQTECHQVYLNGRGAKEEGEAKHEDEANVRILSPQKYFFVEISYISYTR